MLRTVSDLKKYHILGTDSPIPIGHVTDLYFDDESWVMRYLVVETGSWLSSRKVLIASEAIVQADWSEKILRVSITQAQVRGSPDIDTQKPVSRQHERDYLSYYGYPYYWERAGLWGGGPYPELEGRGSAVLPHDRPSHAAVDGDVHLRSADAVKGYHVHATDGDIGYAEGLLIDEEAWAIRFVFVNASGWWLGHTTLLAPEWIERVSWKDLAFYVDLTREQVRAAPTYDASSELTREQEIGVYSHYGRHGYWTPRLPVRAADSHHV
jgi:hypothetical protein